MNTPILEMLLTRFTDLGWNATQLFEQETSGSALLYLERDGLDVAVFFLAAEISANEIRSHFEGTGCPTLFLVHADLIERQTFEPQEYLLVLHALYYGRVYAYDDVGDLWAVHFRVRGKKGRRAPDWQRVSAASWDFLTTETDCLLTWFPGTFSIARFYDRAWWVKREGSGSYSVRFDSPWAILGIAPSASRRDVKAAYRRLARQWHPDLNASPDATERMQEINRAYEQVMGR